jgi:NitT/TauT family transport system permease protein
VLLPLAWGAIVLLAWELIVKWRNVEKFVLPPPSLIGKQIQANFSGIRKTAFATGTNAVIGLCLGVIIAVVVALIAQRFGVVREVISPLSAALNTMPIVALGPIFYNLFGATSDVARRFVVALVVFFPVFVNMLKGLTQVDPIHEELMRSYAVGDSKFLQLVRLPNALPFLLTGIRIAASLSVIAAVVVEYFGGLQNGLGSRVSSAMKLGQTPKAWAYIAAACAMGLVFYVAALGLEVIAMPWQTRRKEAASA